jgi:cytochrome P450
LIQPSLSANLMDTVYHPIIEPAMDDFLSSLPAISRSSKDDGHMKLVPHLRSFFISIALRILLGKSRMVPSGLADDLTSWAEGLLAPPLTFIPWSTAAKAMRARKRICQAMAPLIVQQRLESTEDTNDNISLLGRLVSAVDEETGNKLSDEAILDNVLTLIFAGSDTTVSAATSMWMALPLHPDLKERLKNNIYQVEPFVEAVLRAYPPAPFSFRLVKKPLSVRGYDIPLVGWSSMDLREPWQPNSEREAVWTRLLHRTKGLLAPVHRLPSGLARECAQVAT